MSQENHEKKALIPPFIEQYPCGGCNSPQTLLKAIMSIASYPSKCPTCLEETDANKPK